MTIEQVLDVLEGVESKGGYYISRCPAHTDNHPSLSITEQDGKVLWKCHAGCFQDDVTDAIKALLPTEEKHSGPGEWEATYEYVDKGGSLLYQCLKYRLPDGRKTFRQRHPIAGIDGNWQWNLEGVRLVPYRLPDLLRAVNAGETVVITEGEKDADRACNEGRTATCNPMGAGKWREEFNQYFKGARVSVVADRDEPGRRHAESIRQGLEGVAAGVRVVEPAAGKDLSDHFDAGHSWEDFTVLEAFRNYQPLNLFVPVPPVDWIVEGLVVGGEATLLVADGGSGKSYFALAMSLAVTVGAPFLGKKTKQGRVIYVDEEGSPDLALQRLDELGAQPFHKNYLDYLSFAGVDLVHHPEKLKHDALLLQPQLIVIDSHAAVTNDGEENSNNEMGRVWKQGILPLARETKAAVLVIHHTNGFGSSRGASQIRNSADQELTLQKQMGEAMLVWASKQRRMVQPIQFSFKKKEAGGYELVAQ